MEYHPLDHARDEIRVISIQPSIATSAGRTTNPWIGSISFEGREYQSTSAVRIKPIDDVLHCKIEHVSLLDVIDRNAEQHTTALELPQWRALRWQPNEWQKETGLELSCHPSTIKQQFTPRYHWGDFEALSYTWGTDNLDGRVILNGKLCNIHKNVEDALRRLRALPETQYCMKYWIDALCINQADIPERNAEISRMRRIFKMAWSVVVWLGDESQDSIAACNAVSGIAHLDDRVRHVRYVPHVELLYGKLDWKPVIELLSRPYWTRLWVIQELAMNHRNTTFICGDRVLFREELRELLLFCKREDVMLQKFLNVNSDKSSKPLRENLYGFFRQILNLIDLNEEGKDALTIDDVFNLARHASTSEPRDKVYGIYGLLPKALSSRINVDYSLNVETIFQDFSQSLCKEFGLEELLSWAGTDSGPNLPSWCVDLSRPFDRNHIQWLRKRQANRGQDFAHYLSYDGKILICEGIKLDTIKSVTTWSINSFEIGGVANVEEGSKIHEDFPVVDEKLADALIETLFLCHPGRSGLFPSFLPIPWEQYDVEHHRSDDRGELQVGQRTNTWQPPKPIGPEGDFGAFDSFGSGKQNLGKVWEWIRAGDLFTAFDRFRKANAEYRVGQHKLKRFFSQWQDRLNTTDLNSTDSDAIHDAARNWECLDTDLRLAAISLIGRGLSTTEKGYLALVPNTAKDGDILAIVACPFPVLLRPKEQGYEYIGECYVHEFMDGEAFTLAELPRVEKFSLQ